MESEGSLPRSQKHAIGPHPKSDDPKYIAFLKGKKGLA
jgi:hypothetical protein